MNKAYSTINGIDRMNDTLVILGAYTSDNSKEDLNFDNSHDVWVLPQLLLKLMPNEYPRFDYIFEIHTLHTRKKELIDLYKGEWAEHKKIMLSEYLQDGEILPQIGLDEIPNYFIYPLKMLVDKYHSNYYLCSFSYMLSLALYLGYKKVILRGVNMIMTDDLIQRFSMEYWLGRLQQEGIVIDLSTECDLLRCGKMYGFAADNTLAIYIQRIMNYHIAEIRKLMRENALTSLKMADLFETLLIDRQKFMEEIYNRHDIYYEINSSKEDMD